MTGKIYNTRLNKDIEPELLEKFTLIDNNGKTHLLTCVPQNKSGCGNCFMFNGLGYLCEGAIHCLSIKRKDKRDVIFVEEQL